MAALSTMNDLDSTMLPSAAGYRPQLSKFSAIMMDRNTRSTHEAASATRLPCWMRSSAGPMTGATTANGATVISR
jgi:hypothetical protein